MEEGEGEDGGGDQVRVYVCVVSVKYHQLSVVLCSLAENFKVKYGSSLGNCSSAEVRVVEGEGVRGRCRLH